MTERPESLSIAPEHSANPELLPIRDVVRLTGVNPVTLRAWERRYGLIQPLRTEGGHRLYSLDDVATIRDISSWTERGVAVSKVGTLLERSRPTQNDSSRRVADTSVSVVDFSEASEWLEWQRSIRQALAAFDEDGLEQLYGQIFSTYPTSQVFGQVLLPLWHELRHQTGFGQLSQWLFYDAFLRARVLQRLQFVRRGARQCVLLAALPDQCRELELLVTGLLLSGDHGAIRVLPLGQPLAEMPLLCQAIQPRALVFFAPAPPSPPLLGQLNKLALAIDCPMALAGRGAELVAAKLKDTPVANLGDEPRLMLSRLMQFLAGHLDT
ncbi:MerR family transcriptional regulator [Stutzerimonas nitrititolerans]|uniref:MerR family transcriptional regulator n=1 Tax=Stutzerimonas nitrititolerans TaxID=2482751 RepID=UPI0028A05325|nr:MerR family transcriptional regulator [Stutzerimonas nitrititolerans]